MQKRNKTEQGVTLVAIVITIIVMLILTSATLTFFVDNKVPRKAKKYVEKEKKQIEEQESVSNMVRDLYRNGTEIKGENEKGEEVELEAEAEELEEVD